MLLVVNLDKLLEKLRYQQEEDMDTSIAKYGLVYQSLRFIPRRRYIGKGGWSWRICRDGRPITGRGDCILGMDRRYFYNVGIG